MTTGSGLVSKGQAIASIFTARYTESYLLSILKADLCDAKVLPSKLSLWHRWQMSMEETSLTRLKCSAEQQWSVGAYWGLEGQALNIARRLLPEPHPADCAWHWPARFAKSCRVLSIKRPLATLCARRSRLLIVWRLNLTRMHRN